MMPGHFTFDFVDAPHSDGAAPGTDIMFDSARHASWWKDQTVGAIRTSHHFLDGYLARNGPYDILMGFSQGCSLIGSYLLYHARDESPTKKPVPFKAAIFVCGGMPLPVLEDLGVAVSQRARDINDLTSKLMLRRAGLIGELAGNLDRIKPGVGLWDDLTGLLHDPEKMPEEKDVFGLDFTAMPQGLRITIPTVHIYGAKDPRWPASQQLAHFCENRKMYDHGGGHDIPRTTEVSTRLAELVQELAKEMERK